MKFIDEIKLHEIWKESYIENIKQFSNPDQAIEQSHAIIILTEWDEFKSYDYNEYYKKMEKPSFIFDGRNILDEKIIK